MTHVLSPPIKQITVLFCQTCNTQHTNIYTWLKCLSCCTGAPRGHRYCKTCNIWRPPHAHHCRECDQCIAYFDHHCDTVDACIGQLNQRWFTLFLLSTCTACAVMLLAAIKTLQHSFTHSTPHEAFSCCMACHFPALYSRLQRARACILQRRHHGPACG
jgi:DHHC palmitoyltransferase